MKRSGKIAFCLAVGLALNAGLFAVELSSTNNPLANDPYAPIVDRNVFGLNPPPPPPDPAAEAEKNLPKITPNGIYSVFGRWKVLFKVSGVGKPPKDLFYNLTEGQRQDDIEVTRIDAENNIVTFNNHNVVQELPLVVASASSGPAPAAGGGNTGTPTFKPNGNNNGGNTGDIIRFGGKGAPVGSSRGGNTGNLGGNNAGAPGGPNVGLNFGAPVGGASAHIYQPEAPQMTPEEAAIAIAAAHLKAIQEHDATAPLFPPTPIDGEAGITGGGTPGQ